MGQCFSCNESNHSAHNGHTLSSAIEVTNATQLTTNQSAVKQMTANQKMTFQSASQDESDRKLFTQYSKLAPVRKSSAGDGKRLSLTSKDYSETRIYSLFDQYKDADEDLIMEEGIVKFCSDLDVKPDDFRILVLAWKFQAETMCRFTRTEFITGCKAMHVDSIKGIQSRFPDLLDEVSRDVVFKDFYRWTFKFGLDGETGQRTLPLDIARALWKLVFHQHQHKLLDRWLFFLDEHPCIRGISKDTWDMFLNFIESVSADLCSYDDTAAWPSLFDDFVEYEKDRLNQNTEPSKE